MFSGHMSGWDWFAGSLMMTIWLVVLGLVVYLAVRLAQGNPPARAWPRQRLRAGERRAWWV